MSGKRSRISATRVRSELSPVRSDDAENRGALLTTKPAARGRYFRFPGEQSKRRQTGRRFRRLYQRRAVNVSMSSDVRRWLRYWSQRRDLEEAVAEVELHRAVVAAEVEEAEVRRLVDVEDEPIGCNPCRLHIRDAGPIVDGQQVRIVEVKTGEAEHADQAGAEVQNRASRREGAARRAPAALMAPSLKSPFAKVPPASVMPARVVDLIARAEQQRAAIVDSHAATSVPSVTLEALVVSLRRGFLRRPIGCR